MQKVIAFDLDDTLYYELDYLKSGFQAVSRMTGQIFGLDPDKVYSQLYEWYVCGENPFEKMNATYRLEVPISQYLNVYRFHQPEIALGQDVRETLDVLKAKGIQLGIISDGRLKTQVNKVNALGLSNWIDESCIVINSEKEQFKPDPAGFDRFMRIIQDKLNVEDVDYYYVGDNPAKDFFVPNEKNWNTICMVDTLGNHIHPQNWDLPESFLPRHKISAFSHILDLI